MAKRVENYSSNVFINCPFDSEYDDIFKAIVFTVHRCGFVIRCAKEYENSGQVRMDKIYLLIEESKYSIHDLSRVTLDEQNQLPRFNMPLELGIVFGCQRFGNRHHKEKECLILESKQFDFQKFISDIGGQDTRSHDGNYEKAVKAVRNWLSTKPERISKLPSYSLLLKEYHEFLKELPELCSRELQKEDELTFKEFAAYVHNWLIKRIPES